MAVRRQNITVDPEVFEEFCKYAGPKGIKISTWILQKCVNLWKMKRCLKK